MDQELKLQLDRIEKFLLEHVVTKEELEERLGVMEQTIATKESVNNLTSAVDKFAKTVSDFESEHLAVKHQLLKVQDRVRVAAEKIGVEFKL